MQSSSPSYLLMASLDGARAHAQQQGIWKEPLRAGQLGTAKLQELNGLQVVSSAYVGECCYCQLCSQQLHTQLVHLSIKYVLESKFVILFWWGFCRRLSCSVQIT